jgi:hypothetical protein
MREKQYFSIRTGRHSTGLKFDLPQLKKLFLASYQSLAAKGCFDEAFGYYCVDARDIEGTLGDDASIGRTLLLKLRKENLWPLGKYLDQYQEDDLFDMIEFLFDHVSKPVDGYFHSYASCGMHYSTFTQNEGRHEYRSAMNLLLSGYGIGYALGEEGEIHELPEAGMEPLIKAELPETDPENIEARVTSAVSRFQRYRSSPEDRKHALRELADVLEFLRPKIKNVISTKDEADLFNLANNFGIRHHNEKQKTSYDTSIWYSWLFYHYLATIHACLRLLTRNQSEKPPTDEL